MKAIEDSAFVSARLEDKELILVKYDGSEVNLGSVEGPPGPAGNVNTSTLNNAIAASHPGCVLTTETNQPVVPASATWHTMIWNGADLRDTNNYHAANSDLIKIPAGLGGWYNLSGSIVWVNNNNGARGIRYTINNAGDFRMAMIGASGTGGRSCRVPFSQDVFLPAGTDLRISAFQESGTPLAIVDGCHLSVRFIAPA
jgi:hypothetical protein